MPGSESSNNKRRHSPIEQSSRKRQRTDRDSSSTNQYSIEQLFSSIDELVKKTPSARERRSVSDVSESLANIENILRTTPDLLKLHFEKTAVSTKLSRFISNLRELVSRGYPIKTFPTAIIVKILNSMLREEKSTAYSLTTILSCLGSTLYQVLDQNIPANLIEQVVLKAVRLDADYRALKGCIMGISQLNEHKKIHGQLQAGSLEKIFPLVVKRSDNTIITSALCELFKSLKKNDTLSGEVSALLISNCLKHFTLSRSNRYNADTKDNFGKKSRSFIIFNLKTLGDYECLTDRFEMSDLIHVLKEFLVYTEYDRYIGNYVYYLGTLSFQGHILGRATAADLMKCLKTISGNDDSLGLAIFGVGLLSDNGRIQGRISLNEIYPYFLKQKTLQRISQGMVALGFLSRDNMLSGCLPLAPLIAFIIPFLEKNTVPDENSAHSYVSILVNLQEVLKKGSFEGKIPLGFLKKIVTELLKDYTPKQLGVALSMVNDLLIQGSISQWEGAWLNALLIKKKISQHINYEVDRGEAISIFSELAQISETCHDFSKDLLLPLAEGILLTGNMEIEDALEFLDSVKLLAHKDRNYLPCFLKALDCIPPYPGLDEEHQDLVEALADNLKNLPYLLDIMQKRLKIPSSQTVRSRAPCVPFSRQETRSSVEIRPANTEIEASELERSEILWQTPSNDFHSEVDNETAGEEGDTLLPKTGRKLNSTSKKTGKKINIPDRPGIDLYTAISNNKKAELCALLGIQDKVYVRKFRRVRLTQEGNNGSSTHEPIPFTNSEDLVFAFFSLEEEVLNPLINRINNADYLLALFDACSIKKRFELVKSTACIPLIIQNFNSLTELARFVKIVTFEFQYYRDHKAVLSLNDELEARRDKNLDEAYQLLVLQKIFLKRALKNHFKHTRVRPLIEVALAKVQIELDKLPRPVPEAAPVVTQVSFFQKRPRTLRRIDSPPPQEPVREKPARPEGAAGFARVRINCNYFYETEDIQAILAARIKQLLIRQPSLPGVSVLACAQLNMSGNNIANVLLDYLVHEPLGDSETLLIPIQDHQHWVGLRIDIQNKAIVKVSYFDSNRGENYDYREDARYEEICRQLRENNFIGKEDELTIPPNCMQQPDGSSCGAWLIENFYCDLKGRWYMPEPRADEIRKLHLRTLYSERPDYYAGFAPRQASGQSSMPSESEQRSAHGLNSRP
ncbi:Ulp1 family isopeptidase [Legionella sp. 16cNR16C]|uniref:Ulp1 family isopeptidase n=1 Tax=Legionella sp. 16cNR16C TaxID=2905656 RepID=UPI001E54C338|nr:Ulp1 family isopeptidase [Legionella sp. 16cNR16C]MCE3043540.1 C48 family peptidase [Legionella sp. 16cNR16C]